MVGLFTLFLVFLDIRLVKNKLQAAAANEKSCQFSNSTLSIVRLLYVCLLYLIRVFFFSMNKQANVNVVLLKLLEFWELAAAVWFPQVEVQISADDTKYYYVIAALGSSTESRLVSLITNPPAIGKYEVLKAHLLSLNV